MYINNHGNKNDHYDDKNQQIIDKSPSSLDASETSHLQPLPSSSLPSLPPPSSLSLPPPSSLSPSLPSSSLPSNTVDLLNWLFPMSSILNTYNVDDNHSHKNNIDSTATTTCATETSFAATITTHGNDMNDFQKQNNNTITKGTKKKTKSLKMNLFKFSNKEVKEEDEKKIIIPCNNNLTVLALITEL
jgi:hypothetical protein